MAMERRLTALVETIYLKKKKIIISNTGCWTYRTEKVFQKLKETTSDIYSIHKQTYDDEDVWNNATQEKIDIETEASTYKCDSNGFIKEPLELTTKPFISDEILQNENVIEASEWDKLPSRPTSATVTREDTGEVFDTEYYAENGEGYPNTNGDNEKGYFEDYHDNAMTIGEYDINEPEKGNEKEYANTFITDGEGYA